MVAAQFIRTLRVPFVVTSLLPYTAGALLAERPFSISVFLLGMGVVACVHFSANLMNDYIDSADGGPDGFDNTCYGYFGGSKAVQHGVFEARTVFLEALVFAGAGAIGVVLLTLELSTLIPAAAFLLAVAGGWAYSAWPLNLSKRGMGEVAVVLLFGPLPVIAGYFLQSGEFVGGKGWGLALPYGLMTAALLMANEVPDCSEDRRAGKRHLVVRLGEEKGWLLFLAVALVALVGSGVLIVYEVVSTVASVALISIWPVARASRQLYKYPGSKQQLLKASKLAMVSYVILGMGLVLGVIGGGADVLMW